MNVGAGARPRLYPVGAWRPVAVPWMEIAMTRIRLPVGFVIICACLLLAFALQRYIASLRRIRHNAPDALDRFLKASRFLWRALFLCALLVIGMGLWAFDVRRDPAADFAVGQEIYASNPEPKVQVEFYLAETSPGKGLAMASATSDMGAAQSFDKVGISGARTR